MSRVCSKIVPALVVLLAAEGCTSEYNLVSIAEPAVCGSSCLVTRVGTLDNPNAVAESLGYAVEVAAWGSSGIASPAIDKDSRTVAAGAPTWVNASNVTAGRVWVMPARVSDGDLDTAAPQTLNAPNASVRELGRSLLAVDVRSGRQVSSREGTFMVIRNVAYGEELLAGAPGSYGGVGAVEWFENRGSHSAGWQHGGELVPANGVAGERFGAAVAAPIRFDARYPDETTSQSPAWIAVGAPGRGSVYVYMVLSGLANPFVLLQRIDGPATAVGFGSSLSIADFNNDGFFDLAVGAPQSSNGAGRTYVYTGQVGFTPINTAAVRTLAAAAPASAGGEFGYALASGFFRRNDTSRAGLVVGVPGYDNGGSADAGALCQYQFSGATGATLSVAWSRCDVNPTPGSNNRYGHAVAVGNFNASNAAGSTSGVCGTSEEIAVGIPGDTGSFLLPSAGSVQILGNGENGGEPGTGGLFLRGTRPVEQFGRALASDYVQRSLYEDLVVGAPLFSGARGSVALTKAQSPGGANDPLSGTWSSRDSSGNTFTVRVVWNASASTLGVTMLSNARVTARNNGAVCSILGTAVDFQGVFPFPTIPWTSTAVTHTEHVVVPVGGFNVEADLAYSAATGRFTLNIDEGAGVLAMMNNNCAITNDPFVFTRTVASTCE